MPTKSSMGHGGTHVFLSYQAYFSPSSVACCPPGSSQDRILFHCSGLSSAEKGQLLQDWMGARGRLWSELSSKLDYWHQLPWMLCGLASHHPTDVRDTAARALKLWDAEHGRGRSHHALSARFLDENWQGLQDGDQHSDPPLRPYVLRLARGEPWSSFSQQELEIVGRWVVRFLHIRCVERTTEGLHSIVKRTLARAPGAKPSYLSMELRFGQLMILAVTEPAAFNQLGSSKGFKQAVLCLGCKLQIANGERLGISRNLEQCIRSETQSMRCAVWGENYHLVIAIRH